jgi:hypothetical protein
MGAGWSTPRPGRFTPWKEIKFHCTGGWVGPRASLDGCEKSCPHRDSILDSLARSESLYRYTLLTTCQKQDWDFRQNLVRIINTM